MSIGDRAPIGAKGVTMCVRASGSNLSNFIFLGQRAIKEKSSTQRTLRENLKSTQRGHKIRVIPSEPKILCLVFIALMQAQGT